MTKSEAFDQIKTILNERARRWFINAEARDLDRYDRIVGIVRRVDGEETPAEKQPRPAK